jgi:hypothetical protein
VSKEISKAFMATTPHHTLSKLFQLCTGHGALGNYFKKSSIVERSNYCECGQLETHGTSQGEFGAIECRNPLHALRALHCPFH